MVIKEALSKLSCKYIFLNYKDKMSTLLSQTIQQRKPLKYGLKKELIPFLTYFNAYI